MRGKLLKEFTWEETSKILWDTFGCCYYTCKYFGLSAFDDVGNVQEVYELIDEIVNSKS